MFFPFVKFSLLGLFSMTYCLLINPRIKYRKDFPTTITHPPLGKHKIDSINSNKSRNKSSKIFRHKSKPIQRLKKILPTSSGS